MIPITELKNIIQIRQFLVTRTLILTVQHTVADDLVIDTTYNIVNPILDSGNLLLNHDLHHSDNLKILVNDIDCLFFWISVGLILSSIYYVNHYDFITNDNISFNESLKSNNETLDFNVSVPSATPLRIQLKEKDKLVRLKKFIPYDNIRTTTSFIISLFVFIFTKNVLPAT